MLKRINFQSIPVKDQQRALEFYRDVMEMHVQTDAPYANGLRWIFMKIPGAATKIQLGGPDEITMKPGVPALCLICDDVDTEARSIAGLGIAIADGPADAPWQDGVRWPMFHDSEGNLVLIQSSSMEGA